jgi:hypothetical protein
MPREDQNRDTAVDRTDSLTAASISRGPRDAMGRAARRWQLRRCISHPHRALDVPDISPIYAPATARRAPMVSAPS